MYVRIVRLKSNFALAKQTESRNIFKLWREISAFVVRSPPTELWTSAKIF